MRLMALYQWEKAKLVIEPNGHPEVGSNFCYLAGSAIRSIAPTENRIISDWNFGPGANVEVATLKEELK